MADTAKNQIARAAVLALRQVRRGAGWTTDLGRVVQRARLEALTVNAAELPITSVWMGSPSYPSTPSNIAGMYRGTCRMIVEVWYRSDTAENLDEDGNDVEADTHRALLTDNTLGVTGRAVRVTPIGVQGDDQEFVGALPIGRRVMHYDVEYTWTAATP